MNQAKKKVVIVGRVNVGKSALFNCLTNSNQAIVSPLAGITCDRKCGLVEFENRTFQLVDTGGVDQKSLKDSISILVSRKRKIEILSAFKGMFETAVIRQTKTAIQEADVVLMVVDAEQGRQSEDEELAQVLQKIDKPIILVCNKIDLIKNNPGVIQNSSFLAEIFKGVEKPRVLPPSEEFKELNLGLPVPISSLSGKGRDILLKSIIQLLPVEETLTDLTRQAVKTPSSVEKQLKIVMVGRSGVGKSTLFNQILAQELAVVSDVYQTTIDSNDGQLTYQNKSILLTDTPGLLMKSDIRQELDVIIHKKNREIIKDADVILLVTEVTKSLCPTDKYLADFVSRFKKPIVIVANKWDAFSRKDEEMVKQIMIHYRDYLSKLGDTPIVFTSAITGEGIDKILDLAINPAPFYQKGFRSVNDRFERVNQ